MRYFPPIYGNPEFAISEIPLHFVENTTRRLDSIFKVSAEKYRISGRISEPNPREAQRMYAAIALAFEQIAHHKNIRDIRIPMAIRSVLRKEYSRFALAMLISPDLRPLSEMFPNSIAVIGKEEVLKSYIVTSATIHVLIFDLENNNIAFYRKISGVRYFGAGYWNTFLEDSLSEIFNFYFF